MGEEGTFCFLPVSFAGLMGLPKTSCMGQEGFFCFNSFNLEEQNGSKREGRRLEAGDYEF